MKINLTKEIHIGGNGNTYELHAETRDGTEYIVFLSGFSESEKRKGIREAIAELKRQIRADGPECSPMIFQVV